MESIFKEYQKCEERGTHSSLHFNLSDTIESHDHFITYLSSREIVQAEQKSKTIWVHLNQSNIHLCGHIIKLGFKIHEGLDNKIHLYKWLQKQKDLVPPYSMFFLGCGGVIIDQNCILLVQQKGGPRKDQWGVPGGLLDRGESISQGAVREVWEQTGLKTKFQYIIYFRELNKYIYNSSDLYFSCYLTLTQQSTRDSVNICKREIKDYKWVNLDKLEQFTKENKFGGTQKAAINTILELYKKGFEFGKKPYETLEHNVVSRGVEKRFIQHKISR